MKIIVINSFHHFRELFNNSTFKCVFCILWSSVAALQAFYHSASIQKGKESMEITGKLKGSHDKIIKSMQMNYKRLVMITYISN